MRISCLAIILSVVLGSIFQSCTGSSQKSIVTRLSLENGNLQPELNFTEFKERFRRLVPHMTYYLVSNKVENQSPRYDKYEKTYNRHIPRKTPLNFRPGLELRQRNRYQTNNNEKFLPSVQYDPKDVGPNNDYFTPIRYGMKLNQKDSFTNYQNTRPVYSRPSVENITPENQHLATERPVRLQDLPEREYLPIKQIEPSKAQDYFLDYEGPSVVKQQSTSYDYEQPVEEFESFRYVTPVPYKVQRVQVPNPSISRPTDLNSQTFKVPVSELDHIVKSLQLSNQLPEMLNKDNIDSSIRTLVEILNILHSARSQEQQPVQQHILNPIKLKSKSPNYGFNKHIERPNILESNYYVTPSVIDRPEDFVTDKPVRYVNLKTKPVLSSHNDINLNNEKVIDYDVPNQQEINVGYKETFSQMVKQQDTDDLENNPYKVNLQSENILENDRFRYPIRTEKPAHNYHVPNNVPKDLPNIPPSLKYGATRGKPHVDYPAYSSIPHTNFNCKEQRYKGFFGDPTTRCQVWHYCDLNGGKSSFLCPNGTIFNQVALTCDWWFNVKCESTTQLYVLNERLYKYILPIMPKFPEDFTGPEVDKYLERKFKEIEAKLLEKKLKKEQEEKDKTTKEKIQSEILSENDTE